MGGTATALHVGNKKHVWEIKMTNEEGKTYLYQSRITDGSSVELFSLRF
jgi:acyl-coenzyme A thioesterase PaaI-like protein